MSTHETAGVKRRQAQSGVTLVEIMVAVSLLAVIIVTLLMAFQQAQRAFRTGTSQVDVLENGRAVMNLVSRDLQDMAAPAVPGAVAFHVEASRNASPRDLPLPNGSATVLLQEVFFLTRFNDDWSAIKYALQEDEAGSGVGTLYRSVTNAAWTDLYNLFATNLITEATGPANGLNPRYRRVAEGIVHFSVQAFDRYGNPLGLTNAPEFEVTAVPASPFWNYKLSNTNLPAFVDIELGILEPATLKAFQTKHAISPAAAYGFLQQRSGKVHMFRHRIPIRSQSRLDS